MPDRRRITLMMDLVSSYGRGLYLGITKYAKLIGNWELWTQPSTVWSRRDHPWEWDVSGGVTYGPTTRAVRMAAERGVPMVHLAQEPDGLSPYMGVDDHATGRMAAEHLLDRGVRQFGFVGWDKSIIADRRLAGFRERLAPDHTPFVYMYPIDPPKDQKPVWPDPGLVRWITSVPKPVGVFAYNDELAACGVDAAHSAALAVPEQVAVVGVDNDDVVLQRSHIPISSIELPAARVGYEAAALLDRLMDGEKARPRPATDFPPIQVITRQSTEILAVEDQEVAKAMRFIRDHALMRIGMQDVASAVALSSRSLELRFRKAIGQSPGEFLIRTRLAHAKQLLLQTDLKMSAIARRSAFCSMSHFGAIFRQYVGMTPTAFRENRRIT